MSQSDHIPTFFGKFVLSELIGSGDMKLVVRAFDNDGQRPVALAFMRSRFPGNAERERFMQEAKAISRLQHPNLVRVYESGEIDGQPYFSMELLEGDTLADRILDSGMSLGDAFAVLLPILSALSYCHAHGIFHRDMRAENVLLDSSSAAKLTDFEMATDFPTAKPLNRLGEGRGGIPVYAGSEHRNGSAAKLQASADIFSFGMLMLEVLLGRPTFQGCFLEPTMSLDTHSLEALLLHTGIELPDRLQPVLTRCLSADKSSRYDSAEELHRDLSKFLSSNSDNKRVLRKNARTTPSRSKLAPGQLIGGRYTLVSPLGRGGMGEVWKATDPHRNQPVAIKLLPDILRDNQRELARLRDCFRVSCVDELLHPNICPVFELDDDPGAGVYLAMKYVDGITLSQYCQRRWAAHQEFSVHEVCQILFQVASALDYAHSKQVLHRDIKPDNIMLSDNAANVYLIDFGLAEEIRSSVSRLSSAVSVAGTTKYFAPELWRCKPAGKFTDQFALGVVAFEMLARSAPFTATTDSLLRQAVINDPIPSLAQYEFLNAVFAKVLSKHANERFSNCCEFVDAMRSALEKSPSLNRLSTSTVIRESNSYAHGKFVRGGAVIAAAVAVGLGIIGCTEYPRAVNLSIVANLFGRTDPDPPVVPIDKRGSDDQPTDDKKVGDKRLNGAPAKTDSQDTTSSTRPEPGDTFQQRVNEGLLLMERQKTTEAIKVFSEVLQADPNHCVALIERGIGLYLNGEYSAADADFTRAINLGTTDLRALLYRGISRNSQQLYYLAEDDFSQVIEQAPASADAWECRGDTRFLRHDFENAHTDFQEAIRLEPSRSHLIERIAACIGELQDQ